MSTIVDARSASFEAVTVLNQPMLFTYGYVAPATLPRGVYQYSVRHHSEDTEKPIQITDWALVNRYGSLLTCVPVALDRVPGSYVKKRDINSEIDWQWDGYTVKLQEYLNHYPVQKNTRATYYER